MKTEVSFPNWAGAAGALRRVPGARRPPAAGLGSLKRPVPHGGRAGPSGPLPEHSCRRSAHITSISMATPSLQCGKWGFMSADTEGKKSWTQTEFPQERSRVGVEGAGVGTVVPQGCRCPNPAAPSARPEPGGLGPLRSHQPLPGLSHSVPPQERGWFSLLRCPDSAAPPALCRARGEAWLLSRQASAEWRVTLGKCGRERSAGRWEEAQSTAGGLGVREPVTWLEEAVQSLCDVAGTSPGMGQTRREALPVPVTVSCLSRYEAEPSVPPEEGM